MSRYHCILIIVFLLGLVGFTGKITMAQVPEPPVLTSGYYVVIGAYAKSKEYYAQRYMQQVVKDGYEANYGFSQKRNYFFVYLLHTGNYRASLTKMREVRKIDGFNEAWVYVSLDDDLNTALQYSQTNHEEQEQVKPMESIANQTMAEQSNNQRSEEDADANERINVEVPVMVAESKASSATETENDASNIKKNEIVVSQAASSSEINKLSTLAEATVFFNLYNAQNNNDVNGEIQVIDAERSKLIDVVKGGEYLTLKDPKNGTGKLTLICDVFGYRKVQKDINYYDPMLNADEEDVAVLADIYVVNFELPRYHTGDIVTMYNVYFYKDAALMRPESKYEIGNLQEMLEENPDYKIRIHGHVNGRHPGKIISKGQSGQFFALNDANKEGFGSAKELSRQRAEVIKNYLTDKGIDESRMEIKAWGGRRMLYDKHSASAKRNVRVEIEIVED